ncbi:HemY domain-containing protein, partial [Hoeflea sp. BAL378]|uniref:heme biosynthesis protein HemY n=1 Tax=Hoeflea sp. BAL378 TaxID=1547437 RepID=UPI00051299EC
MIRLLIFVVLILALGFGFAWLADRPGDLFIVWQDRRIEMSLMTAVTLVASLIAAIMVGWWIIRAILYSPRTVSRYFRASKRDRGYQALSTGLLAAGAGDAAMARKMNKRTKGLLNADQEPLIHLLDVQAALIEGRHEEARKLFEAMAEDPETRLLGLRGLYLEAQRQGADEAAQHYAETAAEQAPQLQWAGSAALSYRTREGKWNEALGLLDKQRQAGTLEPAVADRHKAVLLTARARDHADS